MNITKKYIPSIKSLISILILTLFPALTMAHHSSSEFTNTRIELQGYLIQVSWRNPHPSLTLQLLNTEELWNIQIPGTIESLRANNITENSFEIGQSIKITGLTSSRTVNYLQGTHVLFPNGSELILKKSLQPFWTEPNEILSEKTIVNNVITLEKSTYFSKFFLMLSISLGLIYVYNLRAQKNKNLHNISIK